MSRPYFTLVERAPDGPWSPQFGDYDKECVEDERRDMLHSAAGRIRSKDLKIIRSGARQADIAAAIAKLNGEK